MKKVLFLFFVFIGVGSFSLFILTIDSLSLLSLILLLSGVLSFCIALFLCDREYINEYIQEEEDDENGYI